MRELLDENEEKDSKRVRQWAIKDCENSEMYRRSMIKTYHLEQESQ